MAKKSSPNKSLKPSEITSTPGRTSRSSTSTFIVLWPISWSIGLFLPGLRKITRPNTVCLLDYGHRVPPTLDQSRFAAFQIRIHCRHRNPPQLVLHSVCNLPFCIHGKLMRIWIIAMESRLGRLVTQRLWDLSWITAVMP